MHLRCPHCQNPIELADLPTGGEISCAGCGSSFQLANFSTVTLDQKNKRMGKFEVLATVGYGAFGTVLKAHDTELDRIVAIKIPRASNIGPDPQDLDRFLREARSVAQLRFPSIITIHEVGADNGTPYLVCDFVEGITLADLLTGRRPTFHESAKLLAEVGDALQYAHSLGVVHRDVKPSNIMIRPDGSPCVMDFGLAKRDAGEITMTIDGQILGTPAYMSPEQARGEGHRVDGRSDVYSLGVILYQILTGELPFRGNKAMLLHQVLHEEPRGPRTLNDKIPRDLETIALKAMAKEPGRRYGSAKEMGDDLRRWLAGEPILARPVGTLELVWRWCKRKPALAATSGLAVFAVLLLLTGGGAFAWWQDKETTRERVQMSRNGDAVAELLTRCEVALRNDDTEKAGLALEQAEKRFAEGGAVHLADQFARCRADLDLLRELEAIDTFRWIVVEDKLPDAKAVAARWRTAFAEYGLAPGETPADAAGARVGGSHVRDRLLAILDLWLVKEPSTWLRAVLRTADPNVYRDAIRDSITGGDRKLVAKLAGQPEALAQPPGFAAALGQYPAPISVERKRRVLEAALRTRPGDLPLLMALGGTYPINRREGADAQLRWYQAAIAVQPRNVAAHINLGMALAQKGDSDGAVASYRHASRLDPKYVFGHYNVGVHLYYEGDFDGAVSAYKEAIRVKPNFFPALGNLGITLAAKGDDEGAIAAFNQALRVNPKWTQAHVGLGQILHKKGDLGGAIAKLEEAIRLDPKSAPAFVSLGNVLRDKKDFDRAIAAYKMATRLNPNDVTIPNKLRECYVAMGDIDGAIEVAREAVRLYPTASATHHCLGDALQFLKKDPVAAAAAYREAIRLNPIYAWSHNNLGTALRNTGDLDGAIVEFREAIRLDPKHAGALNNLGNALRDKKNPDEAIAAFKEMIRLDPKNAGVHDALGETLRSKKDLGGAIAAYQEAIRLDPTNFQAHAHLGHALYDQKDLDGAVIAYKEAIRSNPTEPHVRNMMGLALKEKGDLDGAIAAFKDAIRLDPNRAYIHNQLGHALKDKGDLVGAITEYKEVIRLDPKNGASQSILARLLATGPDGVRDGKRAVELATRAGELMKGNYPGWIDTLAAAYAEVGDFDKAVEYQKKALARRHPDWEKAEGKEARRRLDLYARKMPYRDPALAAERPRKLAPPSRESK